MNELRIRKKIGKNFYKVFDNNNGVLLFTIKGQKFNFFRFKLIIFESETNSQIGHVQSNIIIRRKLKILNDQKKEIAKLKFQWKLIGKNVELLVNEKKYLGNGYTRNKFILKDKQTLQQCYLIREQPSSSMDIIVEDYSDFLTIITSVTALLIHLRYKN